MSNFSREEIIRLANVIIPGSIYSEGDHLIPMIEQSVNTIMHYDSFASIYMALMINDPEEVKENINKSDLVTLMVFLKFLMTKIEEVDDKKILIGMQEYVINIIQQELASRAEQNDSEE